MIGGLYSKPRSLPQVGYGNIISRLPTYGICPFGYSIATNMANPLLSITVARSGLSRASFLNRIAIRAFSYFPPARRRTPSLQVKTKICRECRRAFAASAWQLYADVESSFDPRQQDRESDEVDVCIVGGGMQAFSDVRCLLTTIRSCRVERSNKAQATC